MHAQWCMALAGRLRADEPAPQRHVDPHERRPRLHRRPGAAVGLVPAHQRDRPRARAVAVQGRVPRRPRGGRRHRRGRGAAVARCRPGRSASATALGRFDPVLAQRTCRADGILIKPHTPIAVTDTSMLAGPALQQRAARCRVLLRPSCGPLVLRGRDARQPVRRGDRPGGGLRRPRRQRARRRRDRVGLPGAHRDPVRRRRAVAGVAAPGGVASTSCWRPSSATTSPSSATPASSSPRATPASRSLPARRGADLIVKGAGETVTITGWSRTPPSVDGTSLDHDAATGLWTLDIDVPSRGWARVEVRTGPV